jgi:hypothetical protein
MIRSRTRNDEIVFDESFTKIEKQIDSTFRWIKVFWIIGLGLSAATACGVIYLIYAAAQWLMANQ